MSDERGSASVLVLGACLLLLAVGGGVATVAALLAGHRQAVRAADLAALAGAQHSLVDQGTACAWAQRVASANGARLAGCTLDGGSLTVVVEVAARSRFAPAVTATARAGPRPALSPVTPKAHLRGNSSAS